MSRANRLLIKSKLKLTSQTAARVATRRRAFVLSQWHACAIIKFNLWKHETSTCDSPRSFSMEMTDSFINMKLRSQRSHRSIFCGQSTRIAAMRRAGRAKRCVMAAHLRGGANEYCKYNCMRNSICKYVIEWRTKKLIKTFFALVVCR